MKKDDKDEKLARVIKALATGAKDGTLKSSKGSLRTADGSARLFTSKNKPFGYTDKDGVFSAKVNR
jgi:hypothetical protein